MTETNKKKYTLKDLMKELLKQKKLERKKLETIESKTYKITNKRT